jgi:hypothetical protein
MTIRTYNPMTRADFSREYPPIYGWDTSYRNNWDIADWDERHAPVPGWGMNPNLAGPKRVGIGGYEGFGLSFPVTVNLGSPFGSRTVSVDVPIEDAARQAIAQIWPEIQQRLKGELPGVIAQAQDALLKQVLPQVQDALLKQAVPNAIAQAQAAFKTTLQKEIQPKADKIVDDGKKTMYLGVGVIVAAVIGSALWVKYG